MRSIIKLEDSKVATRASGGWRVVRVYVNHDALCAVHSTFSSTIYNSKTTKPTAICYSRQNARVLLSPRVQYKEQINKFVKQKQLKQQQKRQILKRSKNVETVNCVCECVQWQR